MIRLIKSTKLSLLSGLVFAMTGMGVSMSAIADNEVYIDQIGDGGSIVIEQDGSSNLVAGEEGSGDKMLISGVDMDINASFLGGNNSLLGNIIGTSTLDLNVDGSSNALTFNVDKDNAYGAYGGDYQLDIEGSNNTLDWDFGSNDTALNADVDFGLVGDWNDFNISVDVSDVQLNWDLVTDNATLDYTATGYDGHSATITGDGDYLDIDITQSSTLQSDSISIDFDGSGTSATPATICIAQSDSGTATGC